MTDSSREEEPWNPGRRLTQAEKARRRRALSWLVDAKGVLEPVGDAYRCCVGKATTEGWDAVVAIENCRAVLEGGTDPSFDDESGALDEVCTRVLEHIEHPRSHTVWHIGHHTGLEKATVEGACLKLVRMGYVRQVGPRFQGISPGESVLGHQVDGEEEESPVTTPSVGKESSPPVAIPSEPTTPPGALSVCECDGCGATLEIAPRQTTRSGWVSRWRKTPEGRHVKMDLCPSCRSDAPLPREDRAALKKEDPQLSEKILDPPLPRATEPFVARDHQVEAEEKVVADLEIADRTTMVAPCGSGKTAIAAQIFGRLCAEEDTLTLILVPRISLVGQSLETWTWASPISFTSFAVCSGEGSTDVQQLRHFMEGAGRRVVACTYQSVEVLMEAQAACGREFDLAVLDEAHHTAGSPEKAFQLALHESSIRIRRRLFMTATPRIFRGRGVSMDDPALYGRVSWHLGLREAIERRIIADYRVVAMAVEVEEVAEAVRRHHTCIDVEIDAHIVAQHVAVAKAIEKYDLRHVVLFHKNIQSADVFSDADHPAGLVSTLKSVGEIAGLNEELTGSESGLSAVHSGKSARERTTIMQRFECSSSALVSNVRCLAEGVDVPHMDGAVFLGRASSWIDVTQMIGRVLRLPPGCEDKVATIVVPILIEDGEPLDLHPILSILSTLKEEDAVMAELLCERWAQDSASYSSSSPLQIDVVTHGVAAEDVARALELKALHFNDRSWYDAYDRLLEFVQQEGTSLVPSGIVCGELALGRWVGEQRQQFRRNLLSHRRVQLLENLPGWAWNSLDAAWENGYVHLLEFVEKVGDDRVLVPERYLCDDGFNLGSWMRAQVSARNNGSLNKKRQERLEGLSSWRLRERHKTRWARRLDDLRNLAETVGLEHINPYASDQAEAHYFLTKTRADHRHDRLTAERLNDLQAIPGWRIGP